MAETKSRRQINFLFSDSSPLTKEQRDRLRREIRTGKVKVRKRRRKRDRNRND